MDETSRRLPSAPATQMASVWTGSELFIWGGDAADGISGEWRLVQPHHDEVAEVAGRSVERAHGRASRVGRQRSDRHRWRPAGAVDEPASAHGSRCVQSHDEPMDDRSHPMPLTANQEVLAVVAVATNDRLYAWEEWQHAVNNADGSGTIYSGIDLYIFDPTHQHLDAGRRSITAH